MKHYNFDSEQAQTLLELLHEEEVLSVESTVYKNRKSIKYTTRSSSEPRIMFNSTLGQMMPTLQAKML